MWTAIVIEAHCTCDLEHFNLVLLVSGVFQTVLFVTAWQFCTLLINNCGFNLQNMPGELVESSHRTALAHGTGVVGYDEIRNVCEQRNNTLAAQAINLPKIRGGSKSLVVRSRR